MKIGPDKEKNLYCTELRTDVEKGLTKNDRSQDSYFSKI
jgi:hypothetical protein